MFCLFPPGFLMLLKFDMNLKDANSLYKCFVCFRDIMKFLSLYIDLRCSFILSLNLFFRLKQETYKCSDKDAEYFKTI